MVALLVAFIVGWVMTIVFLRDEQQRLAAMSAASSAPADDRGNSGNPVNPGAAAAPGKTRLMAGRSIVLLVLLVVALLAPNYLVQKGPYLHKVYVWAAGMILVFGYALWAMPQGEIRRWMSETWWFVRIIFPLLLAGVFVVGIIGAVLPEAWIQRWLGSDTLLSAFLATLLGGVSYFATMTEAPFVDKLMELGMAPGAALALLLTGPGISRPNWLAVGRVFGAKKAVVYVVTVMILGTVFGWATGKVVF